MLGPVHGDFHHTNILVDGADVTFIDFDELAYGDSLVDVGRFIASLRIPALRIAGDPNALSDAGEAFLAEYLHRTGESERQARLFEAASLFISAVSAFRIQRTGWERQIPLLIEEAEVAFGKAIAGPAVPVPKGVDRLLNDFDERIRWATDERYIHARLAPHLKEAFGVESTSCQASIAERAEKVCRIGYEVRGWCGEDRWVDRVETPVELIACIAGQTHVILE